MRWAVGGLLLAGACADPEPEGSDPASSSVEPTADTGNTGTATTTPTDTGTPRPTIPPLTELCVNEFVADGQGAWLDDQGAPSDWIELHNPTAEDRSLDGYFLSDDPDDPFVHPLDAALVIEAGGFLVLTADGLPELGPDHLSFALDRDGEAVSLFRFDGAGERIAFGPVGPDIAWARQPDCCTDVACCAAQVPGGTPGASNQPAMR